MSVMAITATSGAAGWMRRLAAGKRHLIRAPATTGQDHHLHGVEQQVAGRDVDAPAG